MCVIIELKPGYTLPKDMLITAYHNNEDGYGLVLKDSIAEKIQVIQKLQGDPEEIYDLLKDNEDIHRYLHLRNRTEGDINKENLHPFCSYFSDETQVYFFHNGTLHMYKPDDEKIIYEGNVRKVSAPKETISDSNKFNKLVLQPLFMKFHGVNGKADYTDPVCQNIIEKYWGSGYNQGLIVSNKYDPYFINPSGWKVIKVSDTEEFYASNDLYFKEIKRGKEFEKLKRIKDEKERTERESRFQASAEVGRTLFGRTITNLKDYSLKPKKFSLDALADVLTDIDLYTREGVSDLSLLTHPEVNTLVKETSMEDLATLFIYLTTSYTEIYDEHAKLTHVVKESFKTGKITKDEYEKTGLKVR